MLKGDRLRELRLQRGYTHQELAELLEVNIRQIARYESGVTDPSSRVLTRIAEVFDVSADYLVGLSDTPYPDIEQSGTLSAREKTILIALRGNDIQEAIRLIVSG